MALRSTSLVNAARRMRGVRNVLKISELNNRVMKGHTRRTCMKNMKHGEVEIVEKELEKFRDIY